jgi:hypothetical protein
MKKILLLTSVITLLTTSGCIVADVEHHGHARHESHSEVIVVGPPPVVVRAPVIIVRPPEVIVR